MPVDYILNGRGYGEHAEILASRNIGFDPGRLRPYLNDRGVPCVTVNTGKWKRDDNAPGGVSPVLKAYSIESLRHHGIYIPVANTLTTRKDNYIQLDSQLLEVSRKRQIARKWLGDLNTYSGFDGMAKRTLEYEAITDFGEAIIDMDGITQGRNDAPLIYLSSTPMPVIHVDITHSARVMAGFDVGGGQSLSQLTILQSGERIGEMQEQQVIGTVTGIEYGTVSTGVNAHRGLSKVYGMTTLPARITKTDLTAPTGSNPDAIVQDVQEMVELMMGYNFFGPYTLFHSTPYSIYMNKPYAYTNGSNWAVAPNKTVRQAILDIENDGQGGITDVKRLDYLNTANTYRMILVQSNPKTGRLAAGMGLTTVQWPSKGGMQQNWKTMLIEAPQWTYDSNAVAPIVDATTS